MAHRSAISSHSLGRAWVHKLPQKLIAAEKYGLDLEFFYEDLVHLAKHLHQVNGYDEDDLIGAAHVARAMCDKCGIQILCLQPFMHYEGLRDRVKHAARIAEMREWIGLAKILGTDLISIPSSFLPQNEISPDMELIISDFQEIAELGLPDGIRFSYEALCWGTYINTWEQSWRIVEAVDRSNFGICLDTFNMAGKMYADPESITGKTTDADREVEESLTRLRKIPVEKVFFVQVVDAEKLSQPMSPQHPLYVAEQPSRMSWSRNCRLFYGELDRGAYLPIRKILKTIVEDLGYHGPISAEVFHACLVSPDARMPALLAERANTSWQRILSDMPVLGETNVIDGNETKVSASADTKPTSSPVGRHVLPRYHSMPSRDHGEVCSTLNMESGRLETFHLELTKLNETVLS